MKWIEPAQLKDCIDQEMGVSDWFQIDQARIDAFADATLARMLLPVCGILGEQ